MEVGKLKYTTLGNNVLKQVAYPKPVLNSVVVPEADSADSCCSFGKAMVNMQNQMSDSSENTDINDLLTKIASPYTIYRCFGTAGLFKPLRAKLGEEIPNWKNLYDEKANLAYYVDENGCVDDVYLLDLPSKAVRVYNSDAELIKNYTAEEMRALYEYKYHPKCFHDYLRYNRRISLQEEERLWKYIDSIDKCFSEKDKAYKTDKPTVVYRALPSNLSDTDKVMLSTIGAIYKDNSYVSTSQKLETAQRFSSGLAPILEITLPEKSPYLNLDKLFNIDREHWNEQEFLLKRGSEFLITGYDKERNIIKACYLNK